MGLRRKCLRFLFCVLAGVSLVLAIAAPAFAWYWNGWYWPDSSRPLPLYYHFYNSPSQATQDAFTMSVYYWETASNSPIDFTYTSSYTQAHIWCRETYNSNLPNTDGWWGVQQGSYPELDQAEAYLNTYLTSGYYSGKRISVAGHEIGHTLGLDHHFGTLMTEDTYTRWDLLGHEDPLPEDISELNGRYP